MIPKKIHYCWFGRGEKPTLAQKCIASWRKYCPDYEIVEWNEDNFPIDNYPYARYFLDNKRGRLFRHRRGIDQESGRAAAIRGVLWI